MDRRSFLNSTTVLGGAAIAALDLTGASLYDKTMSPQQTQSSPE